MSTDRLCPLNGEMCKRPGDEIPGGSGMSNTSYCGGEEEMNICPTIIEVLNQNEKLPVNYVVSGLSNLVNIYIPKHPREDEVLYRIKNGKVEFKRPDLPDLKMNLQKI